MRDLATVVMTNAPDPPTHNQVVFVACAFAFVLLIVAGFFVALDIARRLDRRDRARLQALPAEPAIETLEEVA